MLLHYFLFPVFLFESFEKRVSSTTLIVNALSLHKILAGKAWCDDLPHKWFCTLADQLIDNNIDELSIGIFTRSRSQAPAAPAVRDPINEIAQPVIVPRS
jgi:hypothetical protein